MKPRKKGTGRMKSFGFKTDKSKRLAKTDFAEGLTRRGSQLGRLRSTKSAGRLERFVVMDKTAFDRLRGPKPVLTYEGMDNRGTKKKPFFFKFAEFKDRRKKRGSK